MSKLHFNGKHGLLTRDKGISASVYALKGIRQMFSRESGFDRTGERKDMFDVFECFLKVNE